MPQPLWIIPPVGGDGRWLSCGYHLAVRLDRIDNCQIFAEVVADDAGHRDQVPPCVFERRGFMRGRAFAIDRDHRYGGGWTRSHVHFARTTHRMAAYSLEATPYRWMMRDHAPTIADIWGIGYDRSLEDAADGVIETSQPTAWVQDHRNQLALARLVLLRLHPRQVAGTALYAKGAPLLEDRPPGTRVLVGAGTIIGKGPVRRMGVLRAGTVALGDVGARQCRSPYPAGTVPLRHQHRGVPAGAFGQGVGDATGELVDRR
jgi:hypothetical protein